MDDKRVRKHSNKFNLCICCVCMGMLCIFVVGAIADENLKATTFDSIYSPWLNGPSKSPKFFPIAVWWQAPRETGHSGNFDTIAAAAAATHINVFLGIGASESKLWPNSFGRDAGDLRLIKENGMYLIAGISTPSTENKSAGSVASILALANSIDAASNVIGYNAGDEPGCSGDVEKVPAVVRGITSFDATRIITYNHTAWMLVPQWNSCLAASVTALRLTSIASFDLYPLTNPWYPRAYQVPKGDFLSLPNDSLYLQGLATRALAHFARPNQPLWVFVEGGGDNLGFSEANSKFDGSTTAGSKILTNVSNWSHFTASWLGLTVAAPGLPTKTKIIQIIDAEHAVLSNAATSENRKIEVAVSGGVWDSDCVAAVNLCVTQGNAYRPKPSQVAAEVWMSIINGANGIEYFCHDLASASFCLGDKAGGPAARASRENLAYINSTLLSYATVLNSRTVASCTMQQQDFISATTSTTNSCKDGLITVKTSNSSLPAAVLVKSVGKKFYLFAQSDRRFSPGASLAFQFRGLTHRTARTLYDSNDRYDHNNSSIGKTFLLDEAGEFSDVYGENGNDYQTKIYAIE